MLKLKSKLLFTQTKEKSQVKKGETPIFLSHIP